MKNIYKMQFKMAILNIRFLFSLLIGFGLCYYGLTDYFRENPGTYGGKEFVNAFGAWFTAMGLGGRSFYALVVPLVAALPFSYTYLEDKTNGYLRNVLLRTTYKNYIQAKFIANAVAGGLAVVLPSIAIFIISLIIYPSKHYVAELHSANFLPGGAFSSLYIPHPFIYISCIFFICFLFGFVYATVGLAASFLVNKKILVIFTPFIFYTLIDFIFEFLEIDYMRALKTFLPWLGAKGTIFSVFLQLSFILYICIYIIINKKEEIF